MSQALFPWKPLAQAGSSGCRKGKLGGGFGHLAPGWFPGAEQMVRSLASQGAGRISQTRGPSPLSSSTTIHQEIWQGPSVSLRLSQPQT